MKKSLILLLIIIIAAFLRFYNLMFDSPYFFNPDERNMANAITQFRLPLNLQQLPSCFKNRLNASPLTLNACNLNPHFFAYGQFPLSLAYFSYQTISFLTSIFPHSTSLFPLSASRFPLQSISFPDAIFWLRFWSATTSVLTVLLVFLISRLLFQLKADPPRVATFFTRRSLGEGGALFAAALCAATPGLIQSAHFGTTESLLTFFFLALIYLAILYSSKKILTTPACHALQGIAGRYYLLLTTLIIGLSLSTKISALIFLPIPLLVILLRFKKNILKIFIFLFLILTSSFLILSLTSPFNLLDHQGFRASLSYESAVAIGLTKVFYTRQFENTTPVLFQAQKIFPHALGYPIFIMGILGFLLLLISNFKYLISKKIPNTKYQIRNTIILFAFLIYFLPNAFLYAKWTRFMTPVFPLFSVFAGYFLYSFRHLDFKNWSASWRIRICLPAGKAGNLGFGILFVMCILPGLAFFTIYTRPDTRVQASQWIYQNIPSGSYVLSETANVVDIPVSLPLLTASRFTLSPISFNFYDLDENPHRFEELLTHLEKADYIFVPSRRIFANHMRLSDIYPLTSKYYELLFSGKLGFEKVAEFSSFPQFQISNFKFQIVDEPSEETWTVFDHPVVRIYQKKIHYNQEEYRNLFRI